MTTLRDAAQQALEALENCRVFVTTREKIKHPEGTEWYDERITALRAALAQQEQEQEPVVMLWKIRKALALASAICDRVPTRWHHTHEIGSAEADIGDMVNAHPDGTHGYRLIQEAEAQLVAYLTTPEAHPPRREWQSLSEEEVKDLAGEDDIFGAIIEFARAVERALKEKNNG